MENQDFTALFDKINHISLNYDDLLKCFIEYAQANDDLLIQFKVLDKSKLDFLMSYPEFLESAVLSARQSVVLAMLSLTIENNFLDSHFNQLCLNCNCQSSKKYYLTEALSEMSKNMGENESLDFAILSQECLEFFIHFEREIFSKILSKNKDIVEFTEVSIKLIAARRQIFLNLIEGKI